MLPPFVPDATSLCVKLLYVLMFQMFQYNTVTQHLAYYGRSYCNHVHVTTMYLYYWTNTPRLTRFFRKKSGCHAHAFLCQFSEWQTFLCNCFCNIQSQLVPTPKQGVMPISWYLTIIIAHYNIKKQPGLGTANLYNTFVCGYLTSHSREVQFEGPKVWKKIISTLTTLI